VPLAILRPEDWDFPLLVHVLGAMLLVGTLVVAVTVLGLGWRRENGDAAAITRFGFRTLALGVIPSYVVMRVGAQWIESREGLEDVAWLDVGYIVSDAGAVMTVIATVLAGLALRTGRRAGLHRTATVLSAVLLLAYVVAIWAHTTKPT
jgi:hypothetical protein